MSLRSRADTAVSQMDDVIRKIPNWLTLSRIGLVPVFVILMIEPSRAMVNLATVVFIVAALTDYADGLLARRYGAVSDLGKLLDPMADKILVMAALVMLTAQRSDLGGQPWVPGWLVVLVLGRETWVTGLRGVAASRGLIVPANMTGKIKLVLQLVSVVLLLLHDMPISLAGYSCSAQFLGVRLLLLSLVFSYWGALEYTREVLGLARIHPDRLS